MSTTDDETTGDGPTINHHSEQARRDRARYGEYRSLMRVSPQNEADNCETAADCRELINDEARRKEPREWVIALFNERLAEVEDDE